MIATFTPATRNRRRKARNRTADYARLEPRHLLAFNGVVSGGTLTLTQTADDGLILVDNNGASNAFRTTDGSGTQTWPLATNVVIQLLPSTGNQLDLDLDNVHTGDLRIDLGDGMRRVNFIGSSNTIQGLLRIDGGSGDQTVDLVVVQPLSVGADLVTSLGDGSNDELLQASESITVQGNWRLFGVNRFVAGGDVSVQNNLRIDSTTDNAETLFDIDQQLAVGGSLQYLGGTAKDRLLLNGVVSNQILGSAMIDLGTAGLTNNTQVVRLHRGSIGGDIEVNAENENGVDQLVLTSSFSVAGNIDVDLGNGDNDATFQGSLSGGNLQYMGGIGPDQIDLQFKGNAGTLNFNLGDGDDVFNIYSGLGDANLLRVDFGDNSPQDRVSNSQGYLDFNATFLNLTGFDAFYSATLDQWDLRQVTNLGGDFNLGTFNDGTTYFVYGMATNYLGAADNLRLTMLNNTGNIDVQLGTPLNGVLIIDAKNGTREINVRPGSGLDSTATAAQLIRIDGGSGFQDVNLLSVRTASLVANLRSDFDSLTMGSGTGNMSIVGNFVARGTNVVIPQFVNLLVTGNLTVNNRFFTEDNSFTTTTNSPREVVGLTVLGKLTYLGGDGRDSLTLNQAKLGDVYLDLGSGPSTGTIRDQRVVIDESEIGFTPGSKGNLIVKAGDTSFANYFELTETVQVKGIASVDFTGNTSGANTAIFRGDMYYAGKGIVYRGSTSQDEVTLEMIEAWATRADIRLGGDSDTLHLKTTTGLDALYADFGAGIDVFDDEFGGAAPFDVEIVNLP